MATMNARHSQYWNGSNGEIWVNGVAVDKVKSFEINMTLDWEDVPAGLTKDRVLLGYEFEGNLSYRKADSNYNMAMHMLFEDYQNGVVPEVTIIGKAFNRASGKTQRIRIAGVTFDNLPIQSWEEASVVEIDMDFKAHSVEVLQ